MKKIILVIFIIFLNSIIIRSQEQLQVPDEIKKLYVYEGNWKADGSMTMGGEVSKGKITHNWSKISDGWGMFIDEIVDVPAMGKLYLGHNIIGYDIGEKQYHMYTIDNFADVHDHKGTLTGNTMTLEFNGVQTDGKAYKEKLKIVFLSNSEYTLSGEAFVEGNSIYTFEGDFKRQ